MSSWEILQSIAKGMGTFSPSDLSLLQRQL